MSNFIPSGSRGGGLRDSFEERQAKINDACSSFIQVGFRSELFALNNLYNHGYTEDKFLELIDSITFSVTDPDCLSHFFYRARQSLYNDPSFTPPNEFRDFIDCMNWMKSELTGARKKKEMSKAHVDLARRLVDSSAPLMQEHKRIESKIDELKKDLMVQEKKSEKISAELKLKLGPIYGYEEPSLSELRMESYLLYEEDCRSKGITPMPKNEVTGIAMVVNVFGDTVKERHLVKFMNDPVRKELIETYLKRIATMGGHGS